jgi:hypothetical protein
MRVVEEGACHRHHVGLAFGDDDTIMPTERTAMPVSLRKRSATGTLKPGSLGQRLSVVILPEEIST